MIGMAEGCCRTCRARRIEPPCGARGVVRNAVSRVRLSRVAFRFLQRCVCSGTDEPSRLTPQPLFAMSRSDNIRKVFSPLREGFLKKSLGEGEGREKGRKTEPPEFNGLGTDATTSSQRRQTLGTYVTRRPA